MQSGGKCMRKSSSKFVLSKFVALSLLAVALVAAPVIKAHAASDDQNPKPPPPSNDSSKASKKGKKADKSSSIDSPKFLDSYHAAWHPIYDNHDYTTAITELKALGEDDRADVANLIGYSYRKLGDYKLLQVWYERALAADPDPVRTWQVYC